MDEQGIRQIEGVPISEAKMRIISNCVNLLGLTPVGELYPFNNMPYPYFLWFSKAEELLLYIEPTSQILSREEMFELLPPVEDAFAFYLPSGQILLNASGSPGIPDSNAEQITLQNILPLLALNTFRAAEIDVSSELLLPHTMHGIKVGADYLTSELTYSSLPQYLLSLVYMGAYNDYYEFLKFAATRREPYAVFQDESRHIQQMDINLRSMPATLLTEKLLRVAKNFTFTGTLLNLHYLVEGNISKLEKVTIPKDIVKLVEYGLANILIENLNQYIFQNEITIVVGESADNLQLLCDWLEEIPIAEATPTFNDIVQFPGAIVPSKLTIPEYDEIKAIWEFLNKLDAQEGIDHIIQLVIDLAAHKI